LEKENAERQNEKDNFLAEITELQNSVFVSEEEMCKAKEHVEQVAKALQEKEDHEKEYNERIRLLVLRVTELQASVGTESAAGEIATRNVHLEEQLSAERKCRTELEAKLTDIGSQFSTEKTKAYLLQAELERLEATLSSTREKAKENTRALETARVEAAEAKEERDTLAERMSAFEQQINFVKAKLDESTQKEVLQAQQLQELKSKIASLEKDKEILKSSTTEQRINLLMKFKNENIRLKQELQHKTAELTKINRGK
jgi:chromosome segregation ATPase